VVAVGDELVLKVIKLDPTERRIGLSLRELHEDVPAIVEDLREVPPPSRGGRRRERGRDRGHLDAEDEEE
jgi:predicted RNA-binding protein with RPS1 domain